jgi:hypothetical protein
MKAGETLNYLLPKVIDPENDNVHMKVRFGDASEFSI